MGGYRFREDFYWLYPVEDLALTFFSSGLTHEIIIFWSYEVVCIELWNI